MKINVKHYEIEVEVSLPDDAAIEDIIDSFKGVLSICGWADDTWKDQIIELSEYYKKDEQKKLITEIMNDDAKDGLYISPTKSNADMNIGVPKKTTAVEWLVEQIKSDHSQKALSESEWMQVIEQAKQMEKEQQFRFFIAGQLSMEEGGKDFEQYYNETY